MGGQRYEADLARMTQRNMATNKEREIRPPYHLGQQMVASQHLTNAAAKEPASGRRGANLGHAARSRASLDSPDGMSHSIDIVRTDKYRAQFGTGKSTHASHIVDWDFAKKVLGGKIHGTSLQDCEDKHDALTRMLNSTNNVPIKPQHENNGKGNDSSDLALDKKINAAIESGQSLSQDAFDRARLKLAFLKGSAKDNGVPDDMLTTFSSGLG